MKVTFPHLGSMHIFCKAIAETAGIPYIVSPETSRKTLTLGVLHSNKCICLPFKIILGNFIVALQMGADTIVMVGSGPPCRLGLYDLVQKVILEDMGLHYRWLTIPPRLTWQAIWKKHEETKELRKELSSRNILLFPYGLWMGPLRTKFKGFDLPRKSCSTRGFECGECGNQCEVIQLLVDHQVVACWGDLCERYRHAFTH
jgi:hypothetical protein